MASMNLNLKGVRIYGDTAYRGDCPKEDFEQISFFSKLRREYPDSYGLIAVHPRNEQKLKGGQFAALNKHKLEGQCKGSSDILIPAGRGFVCEMKRVDHMACSWQSGQREYLEAAAALGAFSCVALGAAAAWEAFQDYINEKGA